MAYYNNGVTQVTPLFFIKEIPVLRHEITDGAIGLRPFRLEDATQLYQAVRESLPELKPWMSWAHDGYSLQESKEFIRITRARWDERTLFAFAMIDAANGSVLGGCSLSHLHPVYHLCNLGYWVRTSRRGDGIAGRATKLAARFAFEQIGLIRVEIVMAADNRASRRVAEKVGAHYEGMLRNRMVVGRSIFDAHMYSLVPQDFGLMTGL